MAWVSASDAAKRLGVSTHTLRRRAHLDPAHPRHIRGTGLGEGKGCRARYWLDDDGEPSAPVAPSGAAPPSDKVDIAHDSTPGAAYWYDDTRDTYVFSLRSRAGKPFAVPGATVKAVVAAYSNDGSAATLNEIARTQGWPRATVREVLKALGKTHDSLPFTDEEIGARVEDDLADDAIRLKEQRVYIKAERADWSATKQLADKARRWDHFVGDRIRSLLQTEGIAPPVPAPMLRVRLAPPADPFTCVVGLTDLHFGAAGWRDEVGAEISREIVRERARSTLDRVVNATLRWGRPAKWLLPIGSDNLHADTDLGTTTKGTPLDVDGSYARIYFGLCSLYEEMIARLTAVAPVELDAVPGNHDRLSTMSIAHWLSARFEGRSDVKINSPVAARNYHLEGRSLICLTHGDGVQANELPLTMAREVPELWGKASSWTVLTGHLHTEIVRERSGVRLIRMPSLATADRWHHRNGYVGNTRAIGCYLFDHAEGLVATLPVQPPQADASK